MTILTDNHCHCAGNATIDAERLNTWCLCPQHPTTLTQTLQIAAVPVFVATPDLQCMAQLIHSIERVVQSTPWRKYVQATVPAIAQRDPGHAGVLYGYDFHLGESGPQLIEINTNAGGALIVSEVLRAQSGCCTSATSTTPACQAEQAEAVIIDSLLDDFAMVRGHRQPQLIAIVDDNPGGQYLYPEFQRFQQLLSARGLHTAICDPRELEFHGGVLSLHGEPVELIYNRLTDFYLENEQLAALRAAYSTNAVIVTPNPYHHALYADKRHLALLSDAQALDALGVEKSDQEILLRGIPQTRLVDTAHAEQLWHERKQFFFKPATSYGGKGAYRGAKLTRNTFEQLMQENYVAQREVEPPLRHARIDGTTTTLKADVRCYVYRGQIQLTAARLWRGQTTNFRTPGGGFATISATHR